VKARIHILPFLFLALIFSCKTVAKSDPQSGVKNPAPTPVDAPEATDIPLATPDAETPVSGSSKPEEVVEAIDTPDIDEEVPSDTDAENEDEEALAEALAEALVEEETAEPEVPIQEDVQEAPVQAEEETAPFPEPPPIESPVVQPPAPPSVQPPVQVPVQPPATPPPAQQNQVPERTPTPSPAPRDPPPPPPPFLGPAEPERPPPVRQEVTPPALPELPSIPRDEAPETPIVFSRVVRMTVGQILEVPFQGTGWVYLGELGSRRGLSYDSRRLDTERGVTRGQSFIFRAETAGTYILKFYRQDFIQDYIINDYVQVIVGEVDDAGRGRTGAVIDRGRVVAEPRWPTIPGAAGSTSETVTPPAGTVAEPQRSDAAQAAEPASPAASGSAPATAAPSQAAASPSAAVVPPEEYVRQAKQEFDAGHVEQALSIIDQMKQRYPSGTDESWWLLGQLYEANSPARDIRQSLECYRTLINQYPQSSRVDDARRRIAYLERYYLNIR